MKTSKITFLTLLFTAFALCSAQAAELASAKVLSATGTVYKYSPDGQSVPLMAGDILKENDSVSVTALSRAELVFSNGSELTIEENTSITLATLEQDSFAGSKSYTQLQADPSNSQTVIKLEFGKLSGHVKNLRSNSKFHIETLLGTIAIRGTTWEAQFTNNLERRETMLVVKNLDGLVDIISKYAGALQYSKGNVAEKRYNSTISGTTTEAIPADHTIVISMSDNKRPEPVITPDFGIIVVSPEGP